MRALPILALAAAGLVGCLANNSSNCEITKESCAGSGGSGGGGNGGGGAGGASPACDPEAAEYVPTASCGRFISPAGDDTTGDGSPGSPYQTFAKALMEGSTIYACEGTYIGSIVIDGDTTIYGGLDCANGWVTKPNGRSSIEANANTVGVAIVSGDVVASGLGVHAAAVAGINVASGASLDLSDSDVLVDDQLDAGGPAANPADPLLDGDAGASGDPGECPAGGGFTGGLPGLKTCLDGVDMVDVSGGSGGNGSAAATGGNGSPGGPMGLGGTGGAGEGLAGMCSGGEGVKGADGADGLGATGPGALMAGAFVPSVGTTGAPGKPGQGGGGGGGANACAGMTAGPGGGGGGSGGCGGAIGGVPGNPGPSAFGILSHGATLALTNVTITVGAGGNGGLGQDGQDGGAGAQPGLGGNAGACAGGQGTAGGKAGGGGGGIGGHSIAIGFTGTEPAQTNVTLTVGAFGLGGLAGNLSVEPTSQGEDGVSCRVFDFGAGTCMTP